MRTNYPTMAIQKHEQISRAVARLQRMRAELEMLVGQLDARSRNEYLERTGQDPFDIDQGSDDLADFERLFWEPPKESNPVSRVWKALSGN